MIDVGGRKTEGGVRNGELRQKDGGRKIKELPEGEWELAQDQRGTNGRDTSAKFRPHPALSPRRGEGGGRRTEGGGSLKAKG